MEFFCPKHGTLLVFQGTEGTALRWFYANLLRFLVVLSVGVALETENPIPLFLVVSFAVSAVMLLRLRGSPEARLLAAALTTVSSILVLLVAAPERSFETRVATIAGAVLIIGGGVWLLLLWRGAKEMIKKHASSDDVGEGVVLGCAATLGTAPVALAAWGVAKYVLDVPHAVQVWLLGAGIGAASGALLIAAIGAAVRTYQAIDTSVRVRWTSRTLAPPRDWAARTRIALERRRTQSSVAASYRLEVFALRIRLLLVEVVGGMANVLIRAGQLAMNLGIEAAELGRRMLIRAGRRIRASARFMMICLRASLRLLDDLASLVAHSTLFPLLGLLSAAIGSWWVADHGLAYLTDGSGVEIARVAAAGVVVWAGTLLAWSSGSCTGLSAALRVDLETAEFVGPQVLLLVVAGGWALGLAGWLGFSSFRPGPITIGATLLVVIVALTQRLWSEPETEP